ncbi:unnamed protein product [Symbiodinium pilosum]|uniref:Uncharacterized protein n=1 Tax=Symbiodinium pilosum TaxID=2952 RepID=A0A812XHM0_SYMPI|nr:unnamed protein product [Symbiodinium pilosum]
MDVPFWWLLVAVFDHVAATNISYAQYFGSGCVSGEREFTCSVSGETLCCQHESQTHGWYCQGSFVNRKDFPGGQDCSGQASQEIVGFLSDTTSIGNINAGECIDYGNTMSFKFSLVPSAAVPCSAALTNGSELFGPNWATLILPALIISFT